MSNYLHCKLCLQELNMWPLKLALDFALDYDVTTGVEVSKIGGNTGFPWMIIHVALIPGLFKSTSFWITEDDKFLVPQNQVVRWRKRFVIRTTWNFPFTTITSGDVAKKEGNPEGCINKRSLMLRHSQWMAVGRWHCCRVCMKQRYCWWWQGVLGLRWNHCWRWQGVLGRRWRWWMGVPGMRWRYCWRWQGVLGMRWRYCRYHGTSSKLRGHIWALGK